MTKGFFPFGQKKAYYAVLAHFWQFWCPVLTLVTLVVTLPNLKKIPKDQKNPKKIQKKKKKMEFEGIKIVKTLIRIVAYCL